MLPVTGASMSIIVFSERNNVAPSFMILRAAASSIRPSRMKCCLSTSGRGLFVRESNTSEAVSLLLGGNGTPVNTLMMYNVTIHKTNKTTTLKNQMKYNFH